MRIRLKEARSNAGLTQKEAARRLYVDRTTLVKWETGVSTPRIFLLPKIAKLYDCLIDDLFDTEDENQRSDRRKTREKE